MCNVVVVVVVVVSGQMTEGNPWCFPPSLQVSDVALRRSGRCPGEPGQSLAHKPVLRQPGGMPVRGRAPRRCFQRLAACFRMILFLIYPNVCVCFLCLLDNKGVPRSPWNQANISQHPRNQRNCLRVHPTSAAPLLQNQGRFASDRTPARHTSACDAWWHCCGLFLLRPVPQRRPGPPAGQTTTAYSNI